MRFGVMRILIWTVIIALVIQLLVSLGRGGHCSDGGYYLDGAYCDEWEGGDGGWWFIP